jgi:hypothetical protein
MSIRTPTRLASPGPYLAEVTNHLDTSAMGSLEVVLKTRIPANPDYKGNTYPVRYMTPFYGITSSKFLGNDPANFNHTQKSYGMWMIPPDVGTTVMVIFVDSDPNQGYWIGCIPDLLQNHMVPGLAASPNYNYQKLTPDQKIEYKDALSLPVGEYNKKNDPAPPDITKAIRPVHPFATVLASQGLLLDDIRGITSSSARREQPSMVFGISTPGPLDKSPGAQTGIIGYAGAEGTPNQTPVSRLGGSTFVMDDGDVDGNNELIRLRTRTGHQILMHNTADLIYIANAKGTAWMEFTSDGKIDIYAADSVSIHTEGDFNFRADRDFNLHAGRDVNLFAENDVNLHANNDLNSVSGNIVMNTVGTYTLTVSESHNIVVGKTSSHLSGGRTSIRSTESIAVDSAKELSLYSKTNIAIDSLLIRETPGSRKVGTLPPLNNTPYGLNLFGTVASSAAGNRDAVVQYTMARVPMKEPWSQHENLDRPAYSKSSTDVAGAGVVNSPTANTPGSARTSKSKIPARGAARLGSTSPGVDLGTEGMEVKPWTTDKPFLEEIKRVAKALNFKPIDLIAAMNLETGKSFNPAQPNLKGSGAMGLIQFMPAIAIENGTTTAELSNMSRVQQMAVVERYFRRWRWPGPVVGDQYNVYLTIFLPAYRYKKDVLVSSSDTGDDLRYYNANKRAYDPNNTGQITVKAVAGAVDSFKRDAILTLKNNAKLDENLEQIK